MIGWKELAIVLVVVLLVFGTRRPGTLGKDLGQAFGGFRKGLADGAANASGDAATAGGDRNDAAWTRG